MIISDQLMGYLSKKTKKSIKILESFAANRKENKKDINDIIDYIPYQAQKDMMNWAYNIFNKELVENERHEALLLGFRGCGKSYFITIISVIKYLIKNPYATFLIQTRTRERQYDIMETLGYKMQELGFKGQFSKTRIRLSENMGMQNPTIKSLTVSSSTKGNHADILIMDDPVEPLDEYSKKLKDRVNKIYQESQNIAKKVLVIGQYVSEDDIYTYLEDKVDLFTCWIDKIPELAPKKSHTMTIREWGKNYEGKIYPNEDAPFKDMRIEHLTDFKPTYAYIDPSVKGGDKRDYTALSIGQIRNNKLYVEGYLFRKSLIQCMDEIVVLIKQCHHIFYEDNVLGIYPYLDFEERGIKTVPTTNNKNKNMRIMNIFKHVQDSSLILLDTSDPQYINQVMTWFVDTRNHDDAPDSLAGLVKIVEE